MVSLNLDAMHWNDWILKQEHKFGQKIILFEWNYKPIYSE